MENIHVSLRLRPLNEREIRSGEKSAWQVSECNTAIEVLNENIQNQTSRNIIQNAMTNSRQLRFNYDRCFDELTNNKTVYENSVQSILKSSLNGVNGTIFMYGQSGSGKTYTMMGYEKKSQSPQYQQQQPSQVNNYVPQRKKSLNNISSANCTYDVDDIDFDRINTQTPEDNKGVLMLALQDFFDTIKMDEDKTYVVRCSYVEIYNDQIHDLLSPVSRLSEVLQVGMNQNKEFYIKGVSQESVSSIEEAFEVLSKGESNKHYAQTALNHHSSRSHSIFKLYVQSISSSLLKSCMPRKSQQGLIVMQNVNNAELLDKLKEHDATLISTSELNFIDLAGSEKISNHVNLDELLAMDTVKDRVKEGQFINKSLFFLTQVISQIAEGKALVHIPYRNSPLTKILKREQWKARVIRSSLGGNARTMIILCITPAQSQFEQSYSTVRFGLNAKKIENKVRVNIQANNNEEALQLLILDYEKKIRDLEISRNEEKCKNADLVKKLNELASQNGQIQQKLMQSNRKNIELSLTKTGNLNSEGVCVQCQNNKNYQYEVKQEESNHLKKVVESIKQYYQNFKGEERTVHCDKVGVLMATKNNLTIKDLCFSKVKDNWQQLVFDYEGRYAFHQYQRRSRQFASYLQLWNRVSSNIDSIIVRHAQLFEAAQFFMHSSSQKYQQNLEFEMEKQYKGMLELGKEKEIELIRRMFYTNVDVAALLGKDVEWGEEPDFKHLKCIVTKETYAHLNLFKDEMNNLATPKLNKSTYREFLSQHKQQQQIKSNYEIEDEILKREEGKLKDEFQEKEDTELNLKYAQIGQISKNNSNNFSYPNSNNQSFIEEKLQYHQNPIPKEQEQQIMNNFEKLQQTVSPPHSQINSINNSSNQASNAHYYSSKHNSNNLNAIAANNSSFTPNGHLTGYNSNANVQNNCLAIQSNNINNYQSNGQNATSSVQSSNRNISGNTYNLNSNNGVNNNQSYCFDGYSTISNIQSVQTPSSASFNQNNIMNSQKLSNNTYSNAAMQGFYSNVPSSSQSPSYYSVGQLGELPLYQENQMYSVSNNYLNPQITYGKETNNINVVDYPAQSQFTSINNSKERTNSSFFGASKTNLKKQNETEIFQKTKQSSAEKIKGIKKEQENIKQNTQTSNKTTFFPSSYTFQRSVSREKNLSRDKSIIKEQSNNIKDISGKNSSKDRLSKQPSQQEYKNMIQAISKGSNIIQKQKSFQLNNTINIDIISLQNAPHLPKHLQKLQSNSGDNRNNSQEAAKRTPLQQIQQKQHQKNNSVNISSKQSGNNSQLGFLHNNSSSYHLQENQMQCQQLQKKEFI